MMRPRVLVIVITLFILRPVIAQPTSRPVGQYSNVELIDRLVEVGNDEFSVQTNILPYGDATQGLPQGLRRLGDEAPRPADAIEELVRRGVPAISDLLAHLDDARPTKAVVKGMFGGITYAAEYDWNRRTDKAPPDGVGSDQWGESKVKINRPPREREYTLAVGDLCYEIVGRVTARGYRPVRYQPTAIVIVNSPVLCPDLCAAVRAQWDGLTPEKHRESLIADISRPDLFGREVDSLPILWRYYPESVPAAVRIRLKIPMYEQQLVRKFAGETLYLTAERTERERLIREFVAENGQAYRDGLILELYAHRSMELGRPMYQSSEGPGPLPKAVPMDILRETFPDVASRKTEPLVDAVDAYSTASFIESMQGISSPDVEQAVWEVLSKRLENRNEIGVTDDLASAVVKTFPHRGHDNELLSYCRRRRTEVADEGKAYFDKLIKVLEEPGAKPN